MEFNKNCCLKESIKTLIGNYGSKSKDMNSRNLRHQKGKS